MMRDARSPTVLEWVRDDRDDFANRYARAREAGAYAMADELLEISDDARTIGWSDSGGTARRRRCWITSMSSVRACVLTRANGC